MEEGKAREMRIGKRKESKEWRKRSGREGSSSWKRISLKLKRGRGRRKGIGKEGEN